MNSRNSWSVCLGSTSLEEKIQDGGAIPSDRKVETVDGPRFDQMPDDGYPMPTILSLLQSI